MERGRREEIGTRQSSERTQTAARRTADGGDLAAALGTQKQRVLAALEEAETLVATPIVRDDEGFTCDGYETLVYEHHHVHLPELEAAGLVEFDRRADEVRRGPRFDERRSVLEDADRLDQRLRDRIREVR